MRTIEHIKRELEPRALLSVSNAHDDARISYRLDSNTVQDMHEFISVIGDYLNYHHETCLGGRLPDFQAEEMAKEIVERHHKRSGGNLLSAYTQANTGLNGGMRKILDVIADELREDALRRYTNHVLDTYVTPNAWPEKVALIRELVAVLKLDGADTDHPERYASDYKALIETYLRNLRRTEEAFFRM
ncbi:hypothetical protein [Cerasicoccus maritimus]|uniref:hypothetical protein n=1 Tax=Cerasicoccus maritimus TaxID=490089 RepID=UPI0028524AC9|nr:hypothetical protein [Cerasicoccus maritimus]